MVIIVATDQHLGYVRSNSEQFSKFLDYVSARNDVTDFVLLGDFVDMWRRDVSGLFLEYHEIIRKVLDLKSKMNVYCIAGNHDYHLLNLTSDSNPFRTQYPLQFLPQIDLPADRPKYLFRHGWEFDPAQNKEIMEILCHNLSDEAGQIRSDIWDTLTKGIKTDVIEGVEKIFDRFKGKDNYLQTIMSPPNERLKSNLGLVEREAFKFPKQSSQILVFGHTHRPFVSRNNDVVNAGSWVSDAEITNTYVVLDGDNIHLIPYGQDEILEREDPPDLSDII